LQLLALQSGGVHLAFFAVVLGLGAWYGRRWHGERLTMLLGRCGVAAVLGYIGLRLVSQTVAQHLFVRALGPQLAIVERLTMLPLPSWGPVQWRGIAVTRSAYLVSRVTLVPPTVTPPEIIAKGPDTPQVRALRTFRLVRLFLDRAAYNWGPTAARCHAARHAPSPKVRSTHLNTQEQFALWIDRGPDPVGGPRETLNGLGFTDVAVAHRTEHGVEFVELDLLEV